MEEIRRDVLIDIRLQSEEARKAAEALRSKISELETEVRGLKKALKEEEDITIALTEHQKKLIPENSKHTEAIKKNTQALNENIKRKKELVSALVSSETALKNNRAEYSKYTSEVNKGKEVFKGAGGALSTIGGAVAKLSVILGTSILSWQGLKKVITSAVESYKEFQYTLTAAQAQLEHNERTLKEGSLMLMQKYGLAIRDTNMALYDAISAGVPATEAIDYLSEAARLSVGGFTDLKVAVEGLVYILNSYSLGTEHAKEVADAFYVAQKYGVATVEQLVQSVGRVAPIAAIAGVSFQDLLGALATLTRGGLNAEESVTILRQAIVAFVKPAVEAKKIMQDMGVPAGVIAFKTAGLVKSLEALNAAYAKSPDLIAEMIPNVRAFTGAAAFSGERMEELKEIIKDVYEDNTSLNRAFEEQMNTFQKRLDVAKSTIKVTMVRIGEALATPVINLTESFARLVDTSKDSIKTWEDTIREIQGELEIIEKGNFTLEERELLMKRVNDEYAAYLPHLFTEEATLENIAKFQKEILEYMQAKFLWMRYEKELNEIYELQAEFAEAALASQKNLADVTFNLSGKYGDLDQKAVDKLTEMYKNLDEVFTSMSNAQDKKLEELKKKYEDLAKALKLDWDVIIKMFTTKIEIPEPGGLPDETMDIHTRERLMNQRLQLTRRMEDAEIALIVDANLKKLAVEMLRHQRMIEDYKSMIIVREGMSEEEHQFNKSILELMEREYKIYQTNVSNIHEEMTEDRKKKDEKALADAQSYNEELLRYRKKYGLDEGRKQLELELKAFEENEMFKTLTVEEQEKGRAKIRYDHYKDYVLAAIELTQILNDTIFKILQQNLKHEFDTKNKSLDDDYNQNKKYLDKQNEEKLIKKKDYEQKSATLEKRYKKDQERLAKEQFNREKRLDIAQTMMAGLLAATRALATYWGTPAGWIVSELIMAEAIASSIAIGAQKFAKGGVVKDKKASKGLLIALDKKKERRQIVRADKGFMVKGPGTSKSDSVPIMASRGEAIINAKSMEIPELKELASIINQVGGGVKFASGGIIGRGISTPIDDVFLNEKRFVSLLKRMPSPVVKVKDIVDESKSYVQVIERARF